MGELFEAPWPVVATAFLFLGCVLFAVLTLILGLAQRGRKSEHRIGERWGGEHVEVVDWAGGEGYVRAGGELWRAQSDEALAPGDRVSVQSARGLLLTVRKKQTS
ncbi:MAG: NfeD family protein [Amphiplicatus sp.]